MILKKKKKAKQTHFSLFEAIVRSKLVRKRTKHLFSAGAAFRGK